MMRLHRFVVFATCLAAMGGCAADPELETDTFSLESASGTVSWTDGAGLNVRSGPGVAHDIVGHVPEGTTVTIECQARGELVGSNEWWDYLPAYGGYVTDRYMNTGYASRISGLPECGSSSGDTGTGDLIVRGHTLDTTQERWVRYIATEVVPEMRGDRATRLDHAATVAWWSLKEGVLDLSYALRYSNCNFGPGDDRHIGALDSCVPGRAWQVGLSGVQAAWMSTSEVEGLASSVHPGRSISSILAEAAEEAGYAPGTSTSDAIVSSSGQLRASWLLREPAVGFEAQYPIIDRECFTNAYAWCFGSGWTTSARFAPTQSAARQAVADLRAILDALSSPSGGGSSVATSGACGDLDYAGVCDGDTLIWCEGDERRSADCSATGRTCGWQSDSVGNNCISTSSSSGGGRLTISEILNGVSHWVTQPFGPTEFARTHASWYEYCAYYGNWGEPVHCAMDVGVVRGTPVYASDDGVVVVTGSDYFEDSRNHAGELRYQLADGTHVIYGHLSGFAVGNGQTIRRGDLVGYTGTMNGDHIHLEVRVPDGSTASGYRAVDPGSFFGY